MSASACNLLFSGFERSSRQARRPSEPNAGSMTLQDLSSIGEIVGATAVVISLVYLAIQVRQNTRQIRENSEINRLMLQENFVSGQQDALLNLAQDPEFYRVWREGTQNSDGISDDDRERFGMLLYSQMYRYHLMLQAKSVEPLEYKRAVLQIKRLAQVPSFRVWWSRQRRYFEFDPDFCRVVDEQIRATVQDRHQAGEDSPAKNGG